MSKPKITTLHITLPAGAGWLLNGLPLRTLGWDDREVDADLDLAAWDAIAPGRQAEIMKRGYVLGTNF